MKSTTVRKNSRKAFTIVEIVIVIAVIAILAAILIPTFAHIISKANLSADQQLVNNLNKILRTEEALEGKNLFMHDAILDLADNGYELDALKMSDSDNILIWDQRYDCFIIVKERDNESGKYDLVYCSKTDDSKYWMEEEGNKEDLFVFTRAVSKTNFWKICMEEDCETSDDGSKLLPNEQDFSIYWGGKSVPVINWNGVFEVGLDLGYCESELNFTNGTDSNPSWLVFNKPHTRVRGNINGILFNATGTYHIGTVTKLYFYLGTEKELKPAIYNVYDIYGIKKDSCHHEFGTVGGVVEVEAEDGTKTNTVVGIQMVTGETWASDCTLVAESGSKFWQSEVEIKDVLGTNFGECFENKGCEFSYSVTEEDE